MASDILKETYTANHDSVALLALELLSVINENANSNLLDSLRRLLASSSESNQVTLSVVLPVHKLYQRLNEVLSAIESYEIIFVNDGSSDRSAEIVIELHAIDPRIKLVNLSRNFGHQAAITAGIDHSNGQAVILMDADLQDPPELIPQMLECWRKGAEVVFAVREKRKEFFLKRAAYFAFYRLLQVISNIDIPLDSGDFCLMDHKVVRHIRALPERNRFLRGLRSWVGYKQIALPYEREARHAGEAKYTFRKLVRLALDGILSFSSFPLRLAAYIGLLTCLAGVIYFAYAIGI